MWLELYDCLIKKKMTIAVQDYLNASTSPNATRLWLIKPLFTVFQAA